MYFSQNTTEIYFSALYLRLQIICVALYIALYNDSLYIRDKNFLILYDLFFFVCGKVNYFCCMTCSKLLHRNLTFVEIAFAFLADK